MSLLIATPSAGAAWRVATGIEDFPLSGCRPVPNFQVQPAAAQLAPTRVVLFCHLTTFSSFRSFDVRAFSNSLHLHVQFLEFVNVIG